MGSIPQPHPSEATQPQHPRRCLAKKRAPSPGPAAAGRVPSACPSPTVRTAPNTAPTYCFTTQSHPTRSQPPMSALYTTTPTTNPTPPATSPPKPPFQALSYLLAPTSPPARLLALLLFLIPASLLLTSINLYRTHLLSIPPPTTPTHLSGPWAAELALGSVRSPFPPPPPPSLPRPTPNPGSSLPHSSGTSSSSPAAPSPPAPLPCYPTSRSIFWFGPSSQGPVLRPCFSAIPSPGAATRVLIAAARSKRGMRSRARGGLGRCRGWRRGGCWGVGS